MTLSVAYRHTVPNSGNAQVKADIYFFGTYSASFNDLSINVNVVPARKMSCSNCFLLSENMLVIVVVARLCLWNHISFGLLTAYDYIYIVHRLLCLYIIPFSIVDVLSKKKNWIRLADPVHLWFDLYRTVLMMSSVRSKIIFIFNTF